jgi:hypothetical protein
MKIVTFNTCVLGQGLEIRSDLLLLASFQVRGNF